MDQKAALILLSVLTSLLGGSFAWSIPSASVGHPEEVTEFTQKKDWPSLILLLKPERGQNFEQDLILARAYLSLERRYEAIELLNEMLENHKDERAFKLRDLASTQFFNQDTANLYYEAIRYMGDLRWPEAKDKLEQALAKEPGQGLVLVRMVQISLILGSKDLEEHLRAAQEVFPSSVELKVYSARAKFLADGAKETYHLFLGMKDMLLQNDVTTEWWLEVLSKMAKTSEVAVLEKLLIKNHPHWSYSLSLFLRAEVRVPYSFLGTVSTTMVDQLEKNLKDASKIKPELEAEAKRSQYYWVGFFTDEALKTQLELWKDRAFGASSLHQIKR